MTCANAGVAAPFRPALTDDLSAVEWVLAVDVLGTIATVRLFGAAMADGDAPGWFLVTGSEHGLAVPHIGMSSYTAAKHAVLGYADVVRAELPGHLGITVVCPGMTATGLWDAGRDARSGSVARSSPTRWYAR